MAETVNQRISETSAPSGGTRALRFALACARWPLAVSILVAVASYADVARSMTPLNFVDSGTYDAAGDHTASSQNYFSGYNAVSGLEHRNWFIFDRAAIIGENTVASAYLAISTGLIPTQDASETYVLRGVTIDPAVLSAGGTGLTQIFDDLASGTYYGTFEYAAELSAAPQFIPLSPKAIADLNEGEGLFVLGGHTTTLSGGGTNEGVFGGTGAGSTRQLYVNFGTPPPVVPALGALGQNGLACLLFLAARRRLRRALSRR